MEWKVTFYTNPDGDTPVQDFLFSLPEKERSKIVMHMTSGNKEQTEEAQAARVRAKLKKSPLAADLLAEEMQNPAFAAMYEEDLAALRLGLALCEAREGLGLTQHEVRARAGVPQETLSRIERGRMPSLGTLQKIADALGVQVVLRPGQAVTVEPLSEQKAA